MSRSISVLEVIPYAAAALLVIAAWAAMLAYFDVFTSDEVKAWRRLAGLRGYATPVSTIERLASRNMGLRRLQDELDLNRLLGILSRSETPLAYLGRVGAISLAATAAALILEFGYRAWQGDWILGLGPWIVLPIGFATALILVADVRSSANKRVEAAGRSLGDMMMLVAIMTDGRGLQLEDAVRILSRCVDSDALEAIVDQGGWRRLVHTPTHSTIELYREIGAEYRIQMFIQLADAAANANVGFSERETYTRVAKSVYQQRLAEARMKAARAKIMVTIPVA
jgi:hypothetical protein